MDSILPSAEHKCCATHIYANWRKKHKGAMFKRVFWAAAKCCTTTSFDEAMENLKTLSREAHKDLMTQNPKYWSKAFFSTTSKCDIVDNNLSKTFNGFILEAREKPIISMLEDIRVALMVRMQEKREKTFKKGGNICSRIMEKLEENKGISRFCKTVWNGDTQYEVQHMDDRFTVDLEQKTCSCRAWDLNGIPCSHGVSAIFYMNFRLEDYVDD